jgi:ribosomal protein L1
MPIVATTFGRALGPTGKMPSPQLGILVNVDDKVIKELIERINTSVKVRIKEASVKVSVGKQSMKDDDLIENIITIYNAVLKAMTKGKENIKNAEIKFTMTKPQKIKIK